MYFGNWKFWNFRFFPFVLLFIHRVLSTTVYTLVCLSQEEVLVKVPEQGAATQHRQYLPSTHTHSTALHLALPLVHILRLYSLAVNLKLSSYLFIFFKKKKKIVYISPLFTSTELEFPGQGEAQLLDL